MFYQSFLSPQVKQWTIINYKRCIHGLRHVLLNDLSLGSYKIRKYQEKLPKLHRMIA